MLLAGGFWTMQLGPSSRTKPTHGELLLMSIMNF